MLELAIFEPFCPNICLIFLLLRPAVTYNGLSCAYGQVIQRCDGQGFLGAVEGGVEVGKNENTEYFQHFLARLDLKV
jgi:hypothetical protein